MWYDLAILLQNSLGHRVAFILGRPKASSQLFLLVRERYFDIPEINPIVSAQLAEVGNVGFGTKSYRMKIGAV
jgi:hypothetical protein